MTGLVDEPLRRRALDRLGPMGDALARTALEHGELVVASEATTWEGSLGVVHGHRVVLRVARPLREALVSSEASASLDGLTAAIAAAMAERTNHTLVDLAIEEGSTGSRIGGGPYRG